MIILHYFYQIIIFLCILNQEAIDTILQQSDLSDKSNDSDDDWPVPKENDESTDEPSSDSNGSFTPIIVTKQRKRQSLVLDFALYYGKGCVSQEYISNLGAGGGIVKLLSQRIPQNLTHNLY